MASAQAKQVLVVDDEQQMLMAIDETLKRKGYDITTASNGMQALGKLKQNFYQAVITDVRMPKLDGMKLLMEVKKRAPGTPVILLTAHGTVTDAVRALKKGAFDYLMKPFSADQLEDILRKATEASGSENGHPERIVTRDVQMKQVLSLAEQAAKSDATVLVEAESGTGKELLSRHIHHCSARSENPFVAVNCAALPDDLLESELFGHEKGSFTGAVQKKIGKFELASGGTILLDEIGEMSSKLQAKLLRVLQEKEIDRVGGLHPLAVDVRVIATTNRDLMKAVEEGDFREDLYYRLNVIPLSLPPLRERKGDIPLLVNHFCRKYAEEHSQPRFAGEALKMMQDYDWPGNVRELENVIRRALALCKNPVVSESDLFLHFGGRPGEDLNFKPGISLKEAEKEMIRRTLDETGGNRTHAAELLGISLRTLRNKLKIYREAGEFF